LAEILSEVGQALANLTTPVYWIAVFAAVLIAGVTGMVPGASGIIIMALSIPFITQAFYGEQRAIGIVMLASMTGVNNTLDSIPAVLLGQPAAATQVTFLEGHQLARKGRAAHTLGAIYAVSALGGLIGAVVLAMLVPIIKPVILKFTPAEVAAVAFFGIAMVSALSAGAMVKGLASGMLGVLFGTVGQAFFGDTRFIFQQLEISNGLPIIAVTLGFFALPEMVDLAIARRPVSPPDAVINNREVWRGARDGLKRWPIMIRQSVFGVVMGAIPGVGAAVIDWLAYAFGIFWSRDKSQFGKGSLDGVLFAESAQNSKEAGQAVPTLTLGVPGGLAWTLVLVAMIQLDLTPGPQLLGRDADVVILLVVTLAIGNFMVTMLGMVATGQLAKLTRVPYPLVGGVIIPITLLSGVLTMTSWLALPLMAVFMGIGIIMKLFQWPRPPLILGIILGRIIEVNFLTGMSLFGPLGVVTRPITIALFVIGIAIAVFFARTAKMQQPDSSQPVPQGATGPTASNAAPRASLLEAFLHVRNLPILLLVGGGMAFFAGSLGFAVWEAWLVPRVMASVVIVLGLIQLFFHLKNRGVSHAQIMDLGMHSLGLPGARQAIVLIAIGFTFFAMLTGTIGLRWATIALAGYLPFTLLARSHVPLVMSLLGGALAAAFTAVIATLGGGGYTTAQVAGASASVGIAVLAGLAIDARGVGGNPTSAGGVAVVALMFVTLVVIALAWFQWPPYNLALGVPLLLLLFVRRIRQYQPPHAISWLFSWRVLAPIITMSFVVLFEFVMADNILFIIWPEPALFEWIGREILGNEV